MTRDYRSLRARASRRTISVSGLFVAAIASTLLVPLWLPLVLIVDAARGRFRFPLARLALFGVCWTWVESVAVVLTFVHWITGRASDPAWNYRLMGWWAGLLMKVLCTAMRVEPRIDNIEALDGGNAIVFSRHASLADSLLSGWVTATEAGLWPRYVLKRELLSDPCLDIVGLRIPNHFLDREAVDGSVELDALRALSDGVGPGVVAVIFPEGTRANDHKRARALQKIGERDPVRAAKMGALRRLLPPRPAGSQALADGAPDADIVFAWHTGFDGLDTFGGIISKLSRPLPPVRFVLRRVPRAEVPTGDEFAGWLDDQWLRMDGEVDEALSTDT